MNNQKLKHKIPNTQNNKGITLIALIITIIVLLILAVVAIGAVQNDGIINHAKNARDEYGKAGDNENATLDKYLEEIEKNLPGNNGGGATEVAKGVKVTGTNGIYTETVGDKTLTAIIPVGFCVVKDIEGDANTITRGLVISDVADDDLANSKKGNQFVWIPVEDYSKFHLIEGYYNGSLQNYLSDEENLSREAGDSNVAGSPMANNNVKGTAESIAMYNSVKTNKGFYIARFEAGIDAKDESGNQIDNAQLATKTATNGTVKPLSQKGVGVWNTIPWGGTYTDTASDGLTGNDKADGAVKVARSMYTKNIECGVTSTLCYGVQWDAVMNYIDSNYYKQDGTLTSFVANSNGKGNYSGSIASTGYYEQNHIFDLSGNVQEWTMEASGSVCRVGRAYSNGYSGAKYTASYRGTHGPSLDDYDDWRRRFPSSSIFVTL